MTHPNKPGQPSLRWTKKDDDGHWMDSNHRSPEYEPGALPLSHSACWLKDLLSSQRYHSREHCNTRSTSRPYSIFHQFGPSHLLVCLPPILCAYISRSIFHQHNLLMMKPNFTQTCSETYTNVDYQNLYQLLSDTPLHQTSWPHPQVHTKRFS